jgi:hypothetical protein
LTLIAADGQWQLWHSKKENTWITVVKNYVRQRLLLCQTFTQGQHSGSVSVQKGKKGVDQGWYIAQGSVFIPWLVEEGNV